MKIAYFSFILFCSFCFVTSCNDVIEDKVFIGVCGTSNCDKYVIISDSLFENAPKDYLDILDMNIEGDCLKIKFASSGCSGDSWEVNLIGPKTWAYTNPPTKDLRLSIKNDELCEAYITKELSFDIRELYQNGGVYILLTNNNEKVFYK